MLLLTTLLAANAALSSPAPCAAAKMPAAITIRGTITEEGATGPFEETIDLRNGYSKMTRTNGVRKTQNGFDGMEWSFDNGIPLVTDVPTLVPTAAAHAFVARLGWNDKRVKPLQSFRSGGTLERVYSSPKMERVTLFSSTDPRRPLRATVDADWGPETTVFSDWRCSGGVYYPFLQVMTDPLGDTQTTKAASVQAAAPLARAAFAVPAQQIHGHLMNAVAFPIRSAGKRDTHIIVDATVNGTTLPLIFDTGGANYFGTQAAQTLGLTVSGGEAVSGIGAGSITGGFSLVPSITVANAVLENEVALVSALPWPATAGAPGGLTGLEFLAEFRTTVDYPNSTILFANSSDPLAPGGAVIPLRMHGHLPVIEASVNGVAGWFGVDTGDGTPITLFKHFTDSAHVSADTSAKQLIAGGVAGRTHLLQSRVQQFAIGGMVVPNARVLLASDTKGAFASRGLAGNLGGGLFHCFRVTFDYQRRVMVLFNDPSTQTCLAALSPQ